MPVPPTGSTAKKSVEIVFAFTFWLVKIAQHEFWANHKAHQGNPKVTAKSPHFWPSTIAVIRMRAHLWCNNVTAHSVFTCEQLIYRKENMKQPLATNQTFSWYPSWGMNVTYNFLVVFLLFTYALSLNKYGEIQNEKEDKTNSKSKKGTIFIMLAKLVDVLMFLHVLLHSFVQSIGVTDCTHHQGANLMHGAMDKITGKNSTKNRQKRNFFPPKRYRWTPDAIPYMFDKSLGEYCKSPQKNSALLFLVKGKEDYEVHVQIYKACQNISILVTKLPPHSPHIKMALPDAISNTNYLNYLC